MKKIKYCIPFLLIPSISIMPILTSCNDRAKDKLVLRSIFDAGVIGKDDYDYWLCAEPIVTTKVKALGLHNVGNVQTLYGANGYNQAVLIAKRSLLTNNPKYLNEVKNYLDGNLTYVSNPDNRETIINNINNNLTPGKSSTLTLSNTTTQTLINCNGKQVDQETDKQSYKTFLDKAYEIDSSVSKPSNPDTYYAGFPSSSETHKEGNYKIICPDGAPAVGLANVLANSSNLCNATSFEFVNPTTIFTRTIRDEPELAVLPANVAAKIANLGHDYVWLTTITWGNLYILSSKYQEEITNENIKNILLNKNMEVMNLPQVPGLILKIILKDKGINYVEK